MSLAPGVRVGSYEIVAPLGAGGMGEVYRARDGRLGREVALKIIPVSYNGDPARLERFEQEARAAGQLNHPSVLVIHDAGTHEGRPYVVSELLEGETLRARLGGHPVPTRKAIAYALHIARGLAAAHDRGLVHRDLKPENVFITKDGGAKILDFGLVKLTQSQNASAAAHGESPTVSLHTQPGTIIGTVGYMSPEQVRASPDVDHRSDIFSFGAVLYEMLWGERAFRGDTGVETLNAILHDTPRGLREETGRVSPALERVVGRCLEKDPDERFQSTRDLVFSLEALADSAASSVSAPGAALSAGRPRAKRAWPALALAGLLCALGLGAFVAVKPPAPPPLPSYRQVTFRRGLIDDARFSPDAQTIYYSASWDGKPSQLFFNLPGSPESSPIQLPGPARLLSISSSGQMAVLRQAGASASSFYGGTLAQVPLAGGEPRDIYENVQWADWSPDGTQLAVVRGVGRKTLLEYPARNLLYQTGGSIDCPRVSPDGASVAFIHHPLYGDNSGSVVVVGRDGVERKLSENWPDVIGLAWAPGGREVWFTASERGANRAIYAVNVSDGARRLVASLPSRLTLTDISRDGRVLVVRANYQCGMMCVPPGETTERDLYWLDGSIATDLSDDGRTLLFVEAREGAGKDFGAYFRRTDGSPAVHIGEGFVTDLSPDGKWALSIPVGSPAQIELLPTGVGERRRLTNDSIHHLHDFESYFNLIGPRFFPDGRRILFTGEEPEHGMRCYVQEVEGGAAPRAITPGGTHCVLVSPDGRFAAGVDLEKRVHLYPVDGGEPQPVRGLEEGEVPVQWGKDDDSLYVHRPGEVPDKIYRLDLASGRRTLWKELRPAHTTGLIYSNPVLITPDGKAYVYSYARGQNDLYLIEGLR